MISFQISDTLAQFNLKSEEIGALLTLSAEAVLASASDMDEADAAIVLTDDEQITSLNQTYLGNNTPTDVLSFPSGEADPETDVTYMGDVIISYPRAVAQAATGGHPVEAELQLLVVHGMLHLCGYDHAEMAEKAEMWRLQSEVLNQLNCQISGPAQEAET
jgi:probable rRNA maturation factor